MELKEKFKLKKIIKELKSKQGKHTELISVYIPQGYDLSNVLNQLAEEKGTASNIKSKTTRKNVMDALEKTIQHLKLFKNTPVNGLAVFCGNVSEREGVQDLKLWSVEPFEPINIRIYRCDQKFVTEPLEALVTPKDVYGLIAIDNKEATIATLKGDHYNILKKLTSGYHGKHRAGGQSQRRFERVIRQESHEFKVRVAEYAENSFLPIIKELKGIIIGGPAGTKDDFFEGDYLHHELKKKIIAVKDITYTNESGIRELIDKSQDILKGVEMVRHKTLMQRFMKELVSDGNFSYGDDVYKALEMGAVEILLLSENLDDETIDKLYEFAKSTNARVEIVSDDFEEGFQLWNTFGGKAALLRFKVS
ncbi:MAG: peptide chain release factor 1 [Candidatus Altiarchaeales archaeon]|nr:MAG: peptide chain release factor 1 [Candidatus Altiarchaeales archaeon ex4484_43]RLI85625.1 MAG: peptide chain release factor 1 [Candidatus Altiarchaeales archaeon]